MQTSASAANVTLIEWPPRSPQLNPVENLWRYCATTTGPTEPTLTQGNCI